MLKVSISLLCESFLSPCESFILLFLFVHNCLLFQILAHISFLIPYASPLQLHFSHHTSLTSFSFSSPSLPSPTHQFLPLPHPWDLNLLFPYDFLDCLMTCCRCLSPTTHPHMIFLIAWVRWLLVACSPKPLLYRMQIPFVGSFGPSSFDGSSGNLLFVGYDFRVYVFVGLFVVLGLYFVLGIRLLFF